MDLTPVFDVMSHGANDVLLWIGFGTLVGLVAKAVLPGRDPGGAVGTLLVGIVGSVIGCATLSYFWNGHRVTPISFWGFVVGTAGAVLLLVIYRVLAGRLFQEGQDHITSSRRSRPRRVS